MVPATPSSAVDRQTIERVKAYKAQRRASPTQYRDRPRLAFIVHSFNRIANLDQLIGGLMAGRCPGAGATRGHVWDRWLAC